MSAYATEELPLVDVVGAAGNRPRGHIALGEPGKSPIGVFTDTGDRYLRFWSYERGQFDAAAARNLASELIRWADRNDDPACENCDDGRDLDPGWGCPDCHRDGDTEIESFRPERGDR